MSQIQTGICLCGLVDQLNLTLQGLVSVTFINCASESILSIYCASSMAIYNHNYITIPVRMLFHIMLNLFIIYIKLSNTYLFWKVSCNYNAIRNVKGVYLSNFFQVFIGNICFFTIYLWRLVCLSRSGQGLINAMKSSKKSLEDFIIKNDLDTTHNRSLSILLKRLDNRAPISPYSVLSLSHRGFAATFSLLLTYFIVLIQFKSSGS